MYVGVSVCMCGCVLHTQNQALNLQTPCRSADVCPMADKAPCRHRPVWHLLGLLVS